MNLENEREFNRRLAAVAEKLQALVDERRAAAAAPQVVADERAQEPFIFGIMSANKKRAGRDLRRAVKKAKSEYAAWPQSLRSSVRLQGYGDMPIPTGKRAAS